jgi:hypothetical protein
MFLAWADEGFEHETFQLFFWRNTKTSIKEPEIEVAQPRGTGCAS